jgi:signal transduction histidine kinase
LEKFLGSESIAIFLPLFNLTSIKLIAGLHPMSEFIAEIGVILAEADQVAALPQAWARLLPAIANYAAGQGCDWTAGLWVSDVADGTRLTLWDLVTAKGKVEQPPCGVSIAVAEFQQHNLIKVCLDRRLAWAPDAAPAQDRLLILPLTVDYQPGRPNALGFISLLLEQEMADNRRQDIDIAMAMASAWLRLNREARTTGALFDLQRRRQSADKVTTLATMLCDVLRDHAHAKKCCTVYGQKADTLGRLDQHRSGASALAPQEFAAHSPVVDWFHAPSDEQEAEFETKLLRFEADGGQMDDTVLGSQLSLRDLIGVNPEGKPVTLLLCRLFDRREKNEPLVPIIFVILACEPVMSGQTRAIGGSFSQLHRQTLALALDYFRNSYSLLLERELLAEMQIRVEQITNRIADMFDEDDDIKPLAQFSQLVETIVPSVISATAIERKIVDNREIYRFHHGDGRRAKPDWLTTLPSPNGSRVALRLPLPKGTCMVQLVHVDKDKYHQKHYWIALRVRGLDLSRVERHLVEQVTAECRAQLNRHLHRSNWALQLGEVRHNMRSVVHSLVGKSATVSELFQAIRNPQLDPAIIRDRLIVRAQYHKAMAQLEYATHQLLCLTENMRTLASGAKIVLQLSSCDLSEELAGVLGLFSDEIERRELTSYPDIKDAGVLNHVSADNRWLHILLFNLIENAVKYAYRRTRIDIRLWAQNGFWRLEVINEGKPIPHDMRSRIFEPYVRVPPQDGEQVMPGTGLGLYSVRRIVELHQMPGLSPPWKEAIFVDSQIVDRPDDTGKLTARNIFRISMPLQVKAASR